MTTHRPPTGLPSHREDGTTTRVLSRSRATDRCLRHHVWMAACADCRDVHARLLRERPGRGH